MPFSIGDTAFETERLIEILKTLGIICLVDVRSIPASLHFSQYSTGIGDSAEEGGNQISYLT